MQIRSEIEDDLTELTKSMKAHGWLRQLPAFKDADGIVIAGHRRLKVAEQLGIEPVIVTLDGDVDRMALAIASNIGAKSMSRSERKKLAGHLYTKKEWTMARIADALNVSQSTITEDLRDLSTVDKSKQPKTATNPKGAGRPKGKTVEKPPRLRGLAIVLPAGMSVTQVGRSGIQLEQNGEAITSVPGKLGVSGRLYSLAKDAALLSERDDLSNNETDQLKKALAEIETTRRLAAGEKIIKELALRIWGRKGHRLKKTGSKYRHGAEQFENAITLILHSCENVVDVSIPVITSTQAASAIDRLASAEKLIRQLKHRIEEKANGEVRHQV